MGVWLVLLVPTLVLSCAYGAKCTTVSGCLDRVCHRWQGLLYGLRLYLGMYSRLRVGKYQQLER